MGASSATTALAVPLDHLVSIPNISLLYLPVILFTAVYFGTGPSLVAASVSVLEYDFFLLQPVFTLSIAQAQDILAFIIFVIVAVLTGQLAARARDRAQAAQLRAAESATLYDLGQALMAAHDVPEVLRVITRRIVGAFDVERCAIFVPDGAGGLRLAAESAPPGRRRDRESEAALGYAYRQGTAVGLPAEEPGLGGQRMYVPLRAADRVVGVMEVGSVRSGRSLDSDARRLVTSFAAQAALAIARAEGEEQRQRLLVVEESDRL
ncbi:MAG: DUF4118 domain-containing protein, partial [Chloroflexi bacterium]|nr:DUF4118 domain-containing protein [Chloroflexota bacterium]